PSQYDDTSVVHEDGRLDVALVGRYVGRVREFRPRRGVFLFDLELYRVALADMGGHFEDGADFFTLNRRERARGARDARGRTAVGAGDQRNLLGHLHFRFLIVHGDDPRRGDDVTRAVALQCLNDGTKALAGAGVISADGVGGAGR